MTVRIGRLTSDVAVAPSGEAATGSTSAPAEAEVHLAQVRHRRAERIAARTRSFDDDD
jgi:hypothetical protein